MKYFDECGTEKRVSTGEKKKSEAIKFLTQFSKNKNSMARANIISYAKIKSQYLNYCKSNCSKSYYTSIKGTLDPFIEENPQLIRKNNVESFITQKVIEGKLFAAHQHYRNLKAFFNWAVDNDYINSSPMEKVKAPKLLKKIPAWITADQLDEIIRGESSQQLKDIYTILFYTGLRANELLTLQWGNIDLESRLLHVANKVNFRIKTLSERTVPLNTKAFDVIARQPTRFRGGLLFVKNDVKINVNYVSKQFKKAVRNWGLNDSIHLHSLRHSFASNLVRQGKSIFKVSKLLGHARVSTTEIYSHLHPEDLRETVECL